MTIACLVILWLSLTSPPLQAQQPDQKTLRFSFVDYPPWSYYESGQFKGLDYELFKAVIEDMGYQITPQLLPTRRIHAHAISELSDLTAVLQLPDIEEPLYSEQLYISKQPLYTLTLCAVALKSRNIRGSTLKDFYRYRLGHVRNHKTFEDAILPSPPKRMRYKNSDSLLKGLLHQRIDIALVVPLALYYNAKQLGVENRIEVIYQHQPIPLMPAWSKAALGDRLIDISNAFDKSVRRLKRQGRFAAIIQHYGELKYFNDYGAPAP
jgi:polar amino acid transport system substrate-binding protein